MDCCVRCRFYLPPPPPDPKARAPELAAAYRTARCCRYPQAVPVSQDYRCGEFAEAAND